MINVEKRRNIMGFDIKEKFKNINKKNLIIAVIVLLAILICTYGGYEYYQYNKFKSQKMQPQDMMPLNLSGEPRKPSEYPAGIEYNQAMKSKKPVLVLFYADWCGYCIRFMPIFQTMSERYDGDMVFSKVNVEDPKYEKVIREIGIGGFPTVYIFDNKYDNKVLISNSDLSSFDSLKGEIERFLRIRNLLDKKK